MNDSNVICHVERNSLPAAETSLNNSERFLDRARNDKKAGTLK